MSRSKLALAAVAAIMTLGTPATASETVGAANLRLLPQAISVTSAFRSHVGSGIALDGFDPVSYFLPGGPMPGRKDDEYIWSGVAWRFASPANKAAFVSRPEAYAPRLGGYDGLVMARAEAVEASPRLSSVVGGRLYLFATPGNRDRFLDQVYAASQAEDAWPGVLRRLERE